MSKVFLFFRQISCFLLMSFPAIGFSQAGKDGAATVSTAGVVFNRYTTLASTANAGSISISVSDAASLASGAIAGAANNPYATAALGYGDLIMIIKMQGATINTTNTVNYGTVTAANNTGVYELKLVRSVSANLITFCSGLTNSYAVGGRERVQVIRIPRLSGLTVNGGASVTASAWSGSFTGGIVALEINGNASINGSVTANGIGYRGGAVENNTSGAPGGPVNYVNSAATDGGEKGESVVGYQADYDALNGRYDRGAPANGGGGGNAHNAGGGGGANADNGNSWSGQGVMVVNASNPSSAWALDPGYIANGNALTNSSGGGRGGYSYGSSNQDATTVAPGNASWGGDNRREAGGLGGRPLTYTANTLFMGGGGGAGDANNSAAQNGGNGGGIIYLLVTGNLGGTGSITANGANAGATISGHNDAPGGAGAGGAIRLNVQGTISTSTITANGGTGGNQLIVSAENEGPGGGGGGGYIRSTGTPGLVVTGGANGTTSSSAVTEFTSNGATAGAGGTTVTGLSFEAAPALDCFPLPVTLVSFEARLNSQKEGILTWVSDQESDLLNYQVEYSSNGLQWQSGITVTARNMPGRQVYTVNTGELVATKYFRLKILNAGSGFAYSEIRVLTVVAKTRVALLGNNILLSGLRPGITLIRVYTASGSQVFAQKLSGETSLTIRNERMAAGLYYLRMLHQDGTAEVLPFVK
ncbi:MAG: hypothetical protein HYZ15_09695 [Sphingobacteriales bacterium]|nr:hypothetical protein [Sphingobacteriales bacterium]